ncbi:MAG TPA: hypothetical protein VH988_21710 [Thermoanaerobaculia bacterium]|nr:hypothetical protein [Thermoanaerobaculia bacterium]
MATLSSMILNELPDCCQRTLALRALENLDSGTAASVDRRLHGFSGDAELEGRPAERLLARATGPQGDPSKWWIFGPLIALAVLWPAYSVYRFDHPKPSMPSDSAGISTPVASSPSAVTAGQDKKISGNHRFGCTDREYFEKLVSYVVQKDNEAFSRGLAAGILAGACTLFEPSESVYITDTAIFSGLVEVRRKGQAQEYWTNLEAVN